MDPRKIRFKHMGSCLSDQEIAWNNFAMIDVKKISQAADAGVAQAVAEKRAEQWVQENREAFESSNAYVEKYGLPLAKYRMF